MTALGLQKTSLLPCATGHSIRGHKLRLLKGELCACMEREASFEMQLTRTTSHVYIPYMYTHTHAQARLIEAYYSWWLRSVKLL